MIHFIITVHILASLSLIAIILFQAGKGAGMANIFGGGGSSGLFTPSSGGFMAKFTAVIAVIFLISSLLLSFSSKAPETSSILQKAISQEEDTSPVEAPLSE